MKKIRVGIAGCGHRGFACFARGLQQPNLRSRADVAALFDHAPTRLKYASEHLDGEQAIFTDYDKFLAADLDLVIVTVPDALHREFTIPALAAGHNCLVEKPLATTVADCDAIIAAAAEYGRSCQVFHNMRYGGTARQIKQIIDAGEIGELANIVFDDFLDIPHGGDYFRRWHSQHAISGGLVTHKGCHALDLLNWYVGAKPKTVFAVGGRKFYVSREKRGDRCLTCDYTGECPCFFDITTAQDGFYNEFYRAAEAECGYIRDRCVFGAEIDIWDTMSISVRYRKGTVLNYLLHAYSPYEGYRIAFNGTKGRLEHHACENTYISGDGSVPGELMKGSSLWVFPMFDAPYQPGIPQAVGRSQG